MNKLTVKFEEQTVIKIGEGVLSVKDWVFPMLVLRAIANKTELAKEGDLEVTYYPSTKLFHVRFYTSNGRFRQTHDSVVELPTMTNILTQYEQYRKDNGVKVG